MIAGIDTVSVSDQEDFAIWKLNADGSVATGFGGGDGLVTFTSIGGNGNDQDFATGLFVDAQGFYVVGGSMDNAVAPASNDDFVVLRLQPDGTLDTGFNSPNGYFADDIAGSSGDQCQGKQIVQDAKGRILGVGWTESSTVDAAIWCIK
ncbi:MAG: hypothetical protein KDE27_12575 [Planctomycetes bacterium]|nr:hypothetical protein [Planctomycetota bacterium]